MINTEEIEIVQYLRRELSSLTALFSAGSDLLPFLFERLSKRNRFRLGLSIRQQDFRVQRQADGGFEGEAGKWFPTNISNWSIIG